MKEQAARVRTGAVVAILAAAGVITWLLLRSNDRSSSSHSLQAKIVNPQELRDFASKAGHPIYWAGIRSGTKLELSENSKGYVFLRYLPLGAAPGSQGPYFTVGTYAIDNAYGRILSASKESGATVRNASKGALVVSNRKLPTNAYFAYPRSGIQIEVFDPVPGKALALAMSPTIALVH